MGLCAFYLGPLIANNSAGSYMFKREENLLSCKVKWRICLLTYTVRDCLAITPQTTTTFMYLYVFRSVMEDTNNWRFQEVRCMRWHWSGGRSLLLRTKWQDERKWAQDVPGEVYVRYSGKCLHGRGGKSFQQAVQANGGVTIPENAQKEKEFWQETAWTSISIKFYYYCSF